MHTHTTIFTGESLLECRLQIDRFCQMDQWLLTPLGRHHRGHCNNVNYLISTCTYIEEYMYGKSTEKWTANEIQNKIESLTKAVLSVPKQEWPEW